jgi:cell surface protein SprA
LVVSNAVLEDHLKITYLIPPDSAVADTPKTKLPYPIKDKKPFDLTPTRHPLDLPEPSVIKSRYELDSQQTSYNYRSTVGGLPYRTPLTIPVSEQLKLENKRQNNDYFRQRAQAQNFVRGGGIIPPLKLGPKVFDRIFGSGVIDIRPRGSAELIFQGNFNTVRNPAIAVRQQRTGQFDFRNKLQINVQGGIGDKMKINFNYDTEATFDFENQMKLDYAGKEDDIIKKIELGNVNLPLNSTLIQGSQSLMGIKTTMQFGKLTVTSVVSQQRGKTTETELQGGAQTTRFDIQADNYDMNRHYFLSQFFRDNYDFWLRGLPIIASPVVINRVEVWITNRSGAFENSRDVMGFSDLGEAAKRDNKNWELNSNPNDTFPGNNSNSLYAYLSGQTINRDTVNLRRTFEIQNELIADQNITRLQPISQYQMINNARLLNPSEYSINTRLGYISLNNALNNDEILCVAFEYTLDGRYFKVGEFTTDVPVNPDNPTVLFTKMLKGPSQRPDLPLWDLMMKNVYALGTFNIQQKDFRLNVIYADDPSGADLNYIPQQNEPSLTGIPLLTVLNLDNLNTQQERAPDGLFDFIEGVTINSTQGRIFFPSVEPFGTYLAAKFVNNPDRARYYSFYELYDSTRFAAMQLPQYNKFFLRGSYQGTASNEISLNSTNIPRGSVRVTANGAPLVENVDYVVDYNLGRVKILNTGLLNSGANIKVSSESNSLFTVQQKNLLGTRFDYKHSNDLIFGGTFMYLNERPLTPKVNIGEEPISNIMLGLDGTYKRDSRLLTKLIDKLPFIETKEISTITVSGEFAKLIPGIQGALAQRGTAYIDDFEGSETPFDMRMPAQNWTLASTPQGQPDLFPEGNLLNNLRYGFNRSGFAWYNIATTFFRTERFTPEHIRNDDEQLSDDCVREVSLNEIFPDRQIQAGLPNQVPTLDLAIYPNERGPYNYNTEELNEDGTLSNPRTKWGGVMRRIDQNDFEASNIDYIEIWMMDPYACKQDAANEGSFYINLGNISEDVLRDNRRASENALPRTEADNQYIDTTVWGRVPRKPVINFAFDADPATRQRQDLGLDGFDDETERAWFNEQYLALIAAKFGVNSQAYQAALADPSNDNYRYYLGSAYDNAQTSILNRYKRFNAHQGNSPTAEQSTEPNYPTTATNIPDNEDINRDFTLNDIEEYFQYKVDISKGRLVVGQNFVTDSVRRSALLKNGNRREVTWYQLKIPIREYEKRVGQIYDFKSIRFMRMFMRGFNNDMVLRFAYLQLVRADWRKYLENLEAGREGRPNDNVDNTQFVVSTVNIEENGARAPIRYVTPPGIQREVDFSAPQAIAQNEQSLSLQVCNLRDGDARAAFRNINMDLRRYGKLRMFLHAEGLREQLRDGDLHAFIRIGTDLNANYYEYEIPLRVTVPPAANANEIWPNENEMVIDLEELINTKIARTNANHPFTSIFERRTGSTIYRVVGLPDLSQARIVMVGIRNPKAKLGTDDTDDGLPKCGEVWFNELRMTDFNNQGGWAANGRVLAKLADFGNVQFTGSIATVGWGGIDKKLNERRLDDQWMYDLQGTFELGKFLPAKSGISIPMFLSYGNTTVRPLYNPLNPDVRLQKEINESTNPEYVDRIRKAADDYTTRRSINFTNVRKNRVGSGKQHFYDIENFSFTYAYTETYRRNQAIEYYILQNYRGMISYNYNFNSKPWEPFSKLIKSKQLQIIKDFNLYFKPQSWGTRFETDRRYGVTINRNNDNPNTVVPPLFDKIFTMNRYYEFRYDITKGLKLDYTSTAMARIDEPLGRIDEGTPEKRDSMWSNFWNGGRLTQFDQAVRLNYTLPINKIQQLSWTNVSYNYTANYQWRQAPPAADSLGNTIQNARIETWNASFNLIMLYNKFPTLRQLNNSSSKRTTTTSAPKKKKKTTKGKGKGKKGDKDKEAEDAEKKKKEAEKEKEGNELSPALAATLRLITSIKNINVQQTVNRGMVLPGFRPTPQYGGQDFNVNAPGFDFLLGLQDPEYRFKAAQNGWLSNDPRITNYYMSDFRQNLSIRATIEPLPDFRIELTATKQQSLSQQSLFRFDSSENAYRDVGPLVESGTYSISYNIMATSFTRERSDGTSDVFKQFEENRRIIAERLSGNPDQPGRGRDSIQYPIGYSRNSQDVLIPAFLAAYSGKDASNVSLSAFPAIPLPNWRVTYNGLTKIQAIKDIFSNITLNHSYSSNYNVGSFQTITDTSSTNISGDYASKYQIRSVSLTERWGPFLGIDVTTVSNVTANFQYKRDRTLNFVLTNGQLSEQTGNELVFGAGYRTNKLRIPFMKNGRTIVLKNDVNFRLDFSIREQVTKVRNLDRPSNEAVAGQTTTSIRPTIEYNINEKLMLRIFYDRRKTDPATSNQFPNIITSGGFSLRYTIQ